MADERRPLSALGTFRQPTPPPPGRVPYGPPEAPPPAPLAFLAPWLEGAVDAVRGGLWGSEGAGDTLAAKAAELASAGLPLLPLKALGFFSRVDKAVDLIPAKGAHPNKVASLLKSTASAEELAYRHVPQFLAGKGNATVTRADLAAHLAAHPAQVPVVKTRGGPLPVEQRGNKWVVTYPDGSTRTLTRQDEARAIAESGTEATKYQQYTVPGGEAYRETLVTLPEQPPQALPAGYSIQPLVGDRRGAQFTLEGPDGTGYVLHASTAEQAHAAALNRLQSEGVLPQPANFRSGHFEEPNILVHTRANERTLPTGERGRFVEEVQSDWHQKGKAEGYQLPSEITAPMDAEYRALVHKNADARAAGREPLPADVARAQELEAALLRSDASKIPDAPFKESWPDLGLKQQVLEAADDPQAQWIGFTGGATQAARYDLSKQIDEIHYQPSQQRLLAFDKHADKAIDEIVTPDKLADYIGKEAAEKLLAQPFDPEYRTSHVLRGAELQVGGEGMRHFYDQVLPKRLEKILKPFGGTVERGALTTPLYDIETQQKNLSGEAAMWFARLTPEMKARILKEGLPLLSLLPLGVLGHYGQQTEEPPR